MQEDDTMSYNSTNPRDSGIDSNQQATNEQRKTAFHYVKYHGYAHDDFAEQGETTQFNGIRVVDASGSGESEEFEDFGELNSSHWTINWASGARLSDGTVLYEGSHE
jgi:hypothetical protein